MRLNFSRLWFEALEKPQLFLSLENLERATLVSDAGQTIPCVLDAFELTLNRQLSPPSFAMSDLAANLASLNLDSQPQAPPSEPSLADQSLLLRQQANAIYMTSPSDSIPVYSAALKLAPTSAPLLANRSQAHLKCGSFVQAYQDAVLALDDEATEMTGELKVKCVVRAGEAAAGSQVWDLAVIVSGRISPICSLKC